MKSLSRSGNLSQTLKFYRILITSVRCIEYNCLGLREIIPRHLTKIPDAHKLWSEYRCIEIAKKRALKSVLDELVKECNIPDAGLTHSKKKKIIKMSIVTLVNEDLVSSLRAVVDGLLSHLESFPFNDNDITGNKKEFSIKYVCDVIEKQYLAWKFKVSLKDINDVFLIYRNSFPKFQSMGNLRRNTDIIEELPEIYNLKVAEKVYHTNQTPLNVSSIINFQENLVGLNWLHFPNHCPKILQYPYQYIRFLISTLQKMEFTDTQIREALPFLHLNFITILHRINFMLLNPKIAKHRNEDKFLQLVHYNICTLGYSFEMKKDCFSELKYLIKAKHQTGRKMRHFSEVIEYCIKQFYEIDSSCIKILERHPRRGFVSKEQILDTLAFLKSHKFKATEVEESIAIIFYPRELVKKSLLKIKAEETTLNLYGFRKGSLPKSTNFFTAGTKSKNKTLQLCLYYLEKSYTFSENDVHNAVPTHELSEGSIIG